MMSRQHELNCDRQYEEKLNRQEAYADFIEQKEKECSEALQLIDIYLSPESMRISAIKLRDIVHKIETMEVDL